MQIGMAAQTCTRMQSTQFTSVFSYAGMPYADAEKNLRLFAAEALPRLQRQEALAAAD